jgi:predicted PurR-regulated permease PerM
MKQHLNISITPGSVLVTVLILIGFTALYLLRDIALLVLTAIVIASSLEPGIAFFMRYRLSRIVATVVMYALVLGGTFGTFYLFFPPLIEEGSRLVAQLPQYLEALEIPSSLESVSLLSSEAGLLKTDSPTYIDTLFSLRDSFSDTSESILRLASAVFGGLFSLLLVIVLSFYFAVQDTGIDDFLRLVTPAKYRDYVLSLWKRSQRKIGLWMQGQLLLSLLAGVLVYLGLTILGVPYALVLAIFTAFMEMIPVFGSFISAVPAIAIAFATGGLSLALIVAGLFLIVNQFQSNLVYPLVVKKIVGVPPLLVILALIAGGQLAGFLGVLLSVPIAAAVSEIVSDIDKWQRSRPVA